MKGAELAQAQNRACNWEHDVLKEFQQTSKTPHMHRLNHKQHINDNHINIKQQKQVHVVTKDCVSNH
jgi:hypothetical protein